MTIKSSVSLTDDQYAFAKALVASGNFPASAPYFSRAWNCFGNGPKRRH